MIFMLAVLFDKWNIFLISNFFLINFYLPSRFFSVSPVKIKLCKDKHVIGFALGTQLLFHFSVQVMTVMKLFVSV